eukprot:TRINITY_DN28177_c0_g1_i1.p1 TRINITY_DN28177_c0_g1~~TRINITY_DN28177_c0_g1_i1.p1  ORF type:complete len:314 (-),score=35.30 TRINITY_DN28177_c0_g1_i1:24-920(-)
MRTFGRAPRAEILLLKQRKPRSPSPTQSPPKRQRFIVTRARALEATMRACSPQPVFSDVNVTVPLPSTVYPETTEKPSTAATSITRKKVARDSSCRSPVKDAHATTEPPVRVPIPLPGRETKIVWEGAKGECIACIPFGKRLPKPFEQAVIAMNKELGSLDGTAAGVGCGTAGSYFFYVALARIVGVVVAEVISTACILEEDALTEAMDEAQWAERSHTLRQPPPEMLPPEICGFSRVWVHRHHRLRGIAHRLLETARARLVYGFEFPPCQCAFSQPTIDGKRLALHFTGTRRFLVFE